MLSPRAAAAQTPETRKPHRVLPARPPRPPRTTARPVPLAPAAQAPRVMPLPRPVPAMPPSALVTAGASIGEEQRARAARQRAAGYEVEIHKKCAIAAACIIFALVGAPVGLRFQRGGVGLVIGVSLAVFTVYYIGLIGGEELGDRLLVSPFFAMWTPNLLFAVLGRRLRPGRLPSCQHHAKSSIR